MPRGFVARAAAVEAFAQEGTEAMDVIPASPSRANKRPLTFAVSCARVVNKIVEHPHGTFAQWRTRHGVRGGGHGVKSHVLTIRESSAGFFKVLS